MSNKLFSISLFVLLTVLSGFALASDILWNNSTGSGSWTDPNNWNPKYVPDINFQDKAKLVYIPGPNIVNGVSAGCTWLVIGDNANGELTMYGGILTVSKGSGIDSWTIVAYAGTDTGTFTMNGGTMNTDNRVYVGFQGNGTLNMNGGTINVGGTFGIGYNDVPTSGGHGTVNLAGGVINVTGTFVMSSPSGCVGKLDFTGGTLVLTGDKRTTVQGYIDSGYITAYGGLGIVNYTYDGVNTTVTGNVNATLAKSPYPANNATNVAPYVTLSWVSGSDAMYHDVYFGTDGNAVLAATTSTPGIYQGRQTANTFKPANLALGQKYYWRIDEVNDPCVYKGSLWQFTTASYVPVDDFESYADTNAMLLSWANGGTGATLSLSTTGGHNNPKAMKFDYNNGSSPYYSEAQNTVANSNWTLDGVKAIDIWYLGSAGNAAVPMYAALEDTNGHPVISVINSDPNAAKASAWTVWRIALTDFNGVNLSNVKKFYLGFGSRSNPSAGGSGTVYFDDIALYPSRCLYEPAVDLNGDCVVDFKDFAIMAANWMISGS